MELHQTSYISIAGVDDPCCGSFDSPCASFKGVLGRMGRNGTVYFHEGSYSSIQGLGNFTDVDWKLIGLGNVIINVLDKTSFDVVVSNLTIANVKIHCKTDFCFSISNSSFHLSHSNVLHDAGNSTAMVDSSTILLSNCNLESNASILLKSSRSQVILQDVEVSGVILDSVFHLDGSQMDVIHSNFSNIDSISLFPVNKV
ncbi:hypothetical protein GEMRC1_009008 [Eukaryota sp. GEM-RC1]